jgi:hypothetical protein
MESWRGAPSEKAGYERRGAKEAMVVQGGSEVVDVTDDLK